MKHCKAVAVKLSTEKNVGAVNLEKLITSPDLKHCEIENL